MFLSLGVVSILGHKDVIEQSCHSQIPGDWERDSEQTIHAKWMQRCQAFLLLLRKLMGLVEQSVLFSKSNLLNNEASNLTKHCPASSTVSILLLKL
jgi:hypothetical protein